MLMVRTKFPGGVLTAPQYLVCDQLASQYANNTMRITTRQDFQFHGIVKSNLRQSMKNLRVKQLAFDHELVLPLLANAHY